MSAKSKSPARIAHLSDFANSAMAPSDADVTDVERQVSVSDEKPFERIRKVGVDQEPHESPSR
jgi:hypothetical protein